MPGASPFAFPLARSPVMAAALEAAQCTVAAGAHPGSAMGTPSSPVGPGTQGLVHEQKTWCWSCPTDPGDKQSVLHPVHRNARPNGVFSGKKGFRSGVGLIALILTKRDWGSLWCCT